MKKKKQKKEAANKPTMTPRDPALKRRWRYVRHLAVYNTIRSYAEALICLVHYRDSDGRDIGYNYEYIRDSILHKFPIVRLPGPHKGKRTKMPFKELQEFACELNLRGVRLPFRPRRKANKK